MYNKNINNLNRLLILCLYFLQKYKNLNKFNYGR